MRRGSGMWANVWAEECVSRRVVVDASKCILKFDVQTELAEGFDESTGDGLGATQDDPCERRAVFAQHDDPCIGDGLAPRQVDRGERRAVLTQPDDPCISDGLTV